MLKLVTDTRQMQESLAKKYDYKPLEPAQSKVMRQFYKDNVPDFLDINGNPNYQLYTKYLNYPICTGYERIVIGDYGAFIEFSKDKAFHREFVCKPGQEYRINDPRYKDNVKYEWYVHICDQDGSKIYYQKKTVPYADYRPGYYYVSVHEVDNIPF